MSMNGTRTADGHTVAGTFFFLWGLWWMIISFAVYLWSTVQVKNKPHNTSTKRTTPVIEGSWIMTPFFPKYLRLLEPILKVLLPLIGCTTLLFFNIDTKPGSAVPTPYKLNFEDGEFSHVVERLYHCALYTPFLVSGVLDFFSAFQCLPIGWSHLFFSFAFFNEAWLIKWHHITVTPLYGVVHNAVIITSLTCGASAILRLFGTRNIQVNALLAGGLLLHGTWYIQIGSLITTKKMHWYQESENNVMFIALLFTAHVVCIVLFMVGGFLLMRSIIKCFSKCTAKSDKLNDADTEKLINHKNGTEEDE